MRVEVYAGREELEEALRLAEGLRERGFEAVVYRVGWRTLPELLELSSLAWAPTLALHFIERGVHEIPAVVVNGVCVAQGALPTLEQLLEALGGEPAEKREGAAEEERREGVEAARPPAGRPAPKPPPSMGWPPVEVEWIVVSPPPPPPPVVFVEDELREAAERLNAEGGRRRRGHPVQGA